jgi:Uma2 family endonuclease
MTGGSLPHNAISLNLASALKNHLRGKGCKVFMADAKVGISHSGPFHYPDVMVTCDSRDQTARRVVYYPCLIVEVLSPGTEHLDQGRNFRNYRRIDTLSEYVLIEAETMNVDCDRLNEKVRSPDLVGWVENTKPNTLSHKHQTYCEKFLL